MYRMSNKKLYVNDMNYIDYLCKIYIVTYILNRMLDVNHIFLQTFDVFSEGVWTDNNSFQRRRLSTTSNNNFKRISFQLTDS